MPYDVFVSYSRRDNLNGRLTTLVEQIRADYRAFAGGELRCFFDLSEINAMDDWRHRILGGLRESNLMLLLLSPAYLESQYCGWEIVEFLKYEHSRSVGGQGVQPVYFVEVSGFDDTAFEARAATWVARIRRRNHVDLRHWYDEGADALKRADVRKRMDDLVRSLHVRLSRLRRMRDAPGNLPAHNPRFVGRETEMQHLHEAAGLGRFGVLTAIQGMGGLGKTALAIQYGYAYADFYSGGRWLIGCAGESSLAGAVRRLESDLGITLTEEEQRDDLQAAKRLLAELERLAVDGAAVHAGDQNPPEPKALLLFDNVEDPRIIQPPESDLLTGRRWLHVIATTRLGPDDLGHDSESQTLLPVDELPEDDALRLIESYQPHGRFPNEAERARALEIVKILGGFTLAVEVVAVHLGERGGRITCAAFLNRLRREGLEGLDGAAMATKRTIRHAEKLLSATLAPTLDLLTPAETLVLTAAALLPPDTIPMPWLRTLATEDYPEHGEDAPPGYDDPWLGLTNHLLGIRLMQAEDFDPDTQAPRLLRMHRLVGELVYEREQERIDAIHDRLSTQIKERSDQLEHSWHEHKWEIPALIAHAQSLLLSWNAKAPTVVGSLCQWLPDYDFGRFSEPMLQTCLAQQEADAETAPSDRAVTLSCLSTALYRLGRLDEAEPLNRRALEIQERVLGMEHPDTLWSVNKLSYLLEAKGDYGQAEQLSRRALEARERVLGPEHPDTLTTLHGLSVLLYRKGDYEQAEPLFRRSLEAREQVLGSEHPNTLDSVHDLGILLEAKGDYRQAEPLFRRALKGYEHALGPEHPDTLSSYMSLASLYLKQGRLDEAEPLYNYALETRERVLGPEHPDTLGSLHDQSMLVYWRGDNTQAIRMIEKVIAGYERAYPSDHRNLLTAKQDLACYLAKAGDRTAAERLFIYALEQYERKLGSDHPDTLRTVKNLADLYRSEGKDRETAVLYRRLLAVYQRQSRKDESADAVLLKEMAICHNNIAIYGEVPARNWPEAESRYRQAMALFDQASLPIECANAELNLQVMFSLSGEIVDLERLRELTLTLEQVNDPRAQKGKKLLEEIVEDTGNATEGEQPRSE